jgi:hypothetical protein
MSRKVLPRVVVVALLAGMALTAWQAIRMSKPVPHRPECPDATHEPGRIGPDVPAEQPPGAAVELPEGYVTYGPYDRDGIPLRDFGGALGVVYHPLVVAEFGSYYAALAQYTREPRYLEGLANMADWLARNMTDAGFWPYTFPGGYRGTVIPAPWVSAVAQGFGAQTLIKAALATGEERYWRAARSALHALQAPVEMGGVRVAVGSGAFFEEVPGPKPTHILNGHLTVLLAAHTYLAEREDPLIADLWRQGVLALEHVLPCYDTGYWSRYDLLPPTEAESQFLILGLERAQHFELTVAESDQANIRGVGAPVRIDPAHYQGIDGQAPDASLTYYRFALLGTPDGRWRLPAVGVKVAAPVACAFVTWPENTQVLLPIDADRVTLETEGTRVSIPGVLLGNPTSLVYHDMQSQQLEEIGRLAGQPVFIEFAARWKDYSKRYGHLLQRTP